MSGLLCSRVVVQCRATSFTGCSPMLWHCVVSMCLHSDCVLLLPYTKCCDCAASPAVSLLSNVPQALQCCTGTSNCIISRYQLCVPPNKGSLAYIHTNVCLSVALRTLFDHKPTSLLPNPNPNVTLAPWSLIYIPQTPPCDVFFQISGCQWLIN